MKNYKMYTESWGRLDGQAHPSSEISNFEIGDICIYLRNGKLPKTETDYDDSLRREFIETVMSPNYFNKKCKILSINKKIWSISTTYKIEFLHDKKITICEAAQLKKAEKKEDIEDDFIDSRIKKTYKSDMDIKLQIYDDTKNGKLKWEEVKYLDKNVKSYSTAIKIPKSNHFLKLELYPLNKEWILKIYFEKNNKNILVRNIKNCFLIANEIEK